MLVMELAKDYMKDNSFNFMLSYEVRGITWEEEAESLKDSILGPLTNPKETGRLEMEESVTRVIQERLLNEIQAEGFLGSKGIFAYNDNTNLNRNPAIRCSSGSRFLDSLPIQTWFSTRQILFCRGLIWSDANQRGLFGELHWNAFLLAVLLVFPNYRVFALCFLLGCGSCFLSAGLL